MQQQIAQLQQQQIAQLSRSSAPPLLTQLRTSAESGLASAAATPATAQQQQQKEDVRTTTRISLQPGSAVTSAEQQLHGIVPTVNQPVFAESTIQQTKSTCRAPVSGAPHA